jgi:hypothetical protein
VSGGQVSQQPVDRLIRELIQTGREATTDETERIAQRMAAAPFTSRVVRVDVDERGISYLDHTLSARQQSLS